MTKANKFRPLKVYSDNGRFFFIVNKKKVPIPTQKIASKLKGKSMKDKKRIIQEYVIKNRVSAKREIRDTKPRRRAVDFKQKLPFTRKNKPGFIANTKFLEAEIQKKKKEVEEANKKLDSEKIKGEREKLALENKSKRDLETLKLLQDLRKNPIVQGIDESQALIEEITDSVSQIEDQGKKGRAQALLKQSTSLWRKMEKAYKAVLANPSPVQLASLQRIDTQLRDSVNQVRDYYQADTSLPDRDRVLDEIKDYEIEQKENEKYARDVERASRKTTTDELAGLTSTISRGIPRLAKDLVPGSVKKLLESRSYITDENRTKKVYDIKRRKKALKELTDAESDLERISKLSDASSLKKKEIDTLLKALRDKKEAILDEDFTRQEKLDMLPASQVKKIASDMGIFFRARDNKSVIIASIIQAENKPTPKPASSSSSSITSPLLTGPRRSILGFKSPSSSKPSSPSSKGSKTPPRKSSIIIPKVGKPSSRSSSSSSSSAKTTPSSVLPLSSSEDESGKEQETDEDSDGGQSIPDLESGDEDQSGSGRYISRGIIPFYTPKQIGMGKAIRGMYDDEIDTALSDIPEFIGTYPSNFTRELKGLKPELPIAMVLNVQPSYVDTSKHGGHWVAVWIDDNSVEYFDPLGDEIDMSMLTDIKKFVDSLGLTNMLKYKQNNIKFQKETTDTCGHHCIRFITERSKGIPFKTATKWDQSHKKEKELKKFGYI